MKKVLRKFKPYKNKLRIPDKSEFEEVKRVLIGFPNTEGLPEEEARSTVQKYWDDRKEQNVEWRDKNYIPKDLSRYPGFPQTEGLPKEEVDELVKNFWKQYNEKRTVFPQGFWTEPTALIPKDKTQYPDFPNIEGLSKEEADRSIIEFWKKFKEKKDQRKQDLKETDNVRKMQFRKKFKK